MTYAWLYRCREQHTPDPNPGVGPERVAELHAMHLNGTLAAYCDCILTSTRKRAA